MLSDKAGGMADLTPCPPLQTVALCEAIDLVFGEGEGISRGGAAPSRRDYSLWGEGGMMTRRWKYEGGREPFDRLRMSGIKKSGKKTILRGRAGWEKIRRNKESDARVIDTIKI
jgi:hypothetical protein